MHPPLSRPRFRLRPSVRRAIARLNKSQNAVARECGVGSGYMSQLLTGARLPGPRVRQRLIEVTGLTFDELFDEVSA